MNEMKKEIAILDEEFETEIKRCKKTVEELISDYNAGYRPQLHQFIVEDVLRWADENGDSETLDLFFSLVEIKIKNGERVETLSKADEKKFLIFFRDKHFVKLTKKVDEKKKENKIPKRQAMLRDAMAKYGKKYQAKKSA